MRCIPKYLLIHRAKLYEEDNGGFFGAESGEPIELSFIRIDYSGKINRDGVKGFNDKASGEALLIYDCKNSLPSAVEFCIGQRVVFSGRSFSVSGVRVLYGRSAPHHIEVSLEEIGT